MDTPRSDVFRGRTIRTAHLLSSLHGAEGTTELLEFAKQIGLNPAWIQYKGTPKEHFDLMGVKCDAARRAGAVEDRYALVNAIRTKRGLPVLERPTTEASDVG